MYKSALFYEEKKTSIDLERYPDKTLWLFLKAGPFEWITSEKAVILTNKSPMKHNISGESLLRYACVLA